MSSQKPEKRSLHEDRRKENHGAPDGNERRVAESDRRKENNEEYVSFYVGGHLLGIPVVKIQEVLNARTITPVPLAPKAVAGLLNLRGQIVTAVDLRSRLDLAPRGQDEQPMSIVVDHEGELYSLLVDSVEDVIEVDRSILAAAPATLDEVWQHCCEGVYRLKRGLLLVVKVPSLLNSEAKKM